MKCSFCRKKRSEQDLLTPRMQILATVCFLFFLTAKPGQANDPNPFLPAGVEDRGWPDVRGPDFDAHSPEINLADSWPEEGLPVLWVKELGQGYSAFVAQGNRVYTQAQTLQGQYVYCLEAKTGKTIWQYRYDWPYELAGVYPGPRATPTLVAGKVLFAAPSGLIGCLDADEGKLIWSRNVLEEFHGTGGDGFGYACSPTVVDQLVILPVGGPDASLVALNLNDGKTVWQAGNRPASYCPAFPIERKGQKLVVGYLENALVIHDLQTGELLLEHELSEGYDEHSAWPLYREPYLWLAAPFRSGSQLLELPDQFPHSESLKTVWRSRVMSNDVLSSVLVDGRVYGFDIFDQQSKTQRPSRGKFRCIDFLTGEELWEQGSGRPERSTNDISDELGQSGIIVADGKLILLNERGELILLRQNPEQCDILARCSILSGELTWTPPVLHSGCVFIRNQSRAACVYIGDPDLLATDQATLNLADIPQEAYYDWAGQILSVEPEYAFDLPSTEWLFRWYYWSLGLLIVSLMLAAVPIWWIPAQYRRRVWIRSYRIMAFLAGALGTTWISLWYQDFIFTWPLCLYIATEPVLESVQFRREGQRAAIWRDYGPLIGLIGVFTFYFLICRRLSLVFEWAFLAGPIGALPAGCSEWYLKPQTPLQVCFVLLLKLITFTCFYASGVFVLWLRY